MLEQYKKELLETKSLSLKIKVHAGAKSNRIKSLLSDGTIKIDIATAPEDGKANDVLIALLAAEFEVPKNNITIIMGSFSHDKVIKIIA
jgi:uncharacterized protein (TIGR00251 family)